MAKKKKQPVVDEEVKIEEKVEEAPQPAITLNVARPKSVNFNGSIQQAATLGNMNNSIGNKYENVRTVLQNIYNQGYLDGARADKIRRIDFDAEGNIKIN